MENQIQQFDSSLKTAQTAQSSFANVLEDTWGKSGAKGGMRVEDLGANNSHSNKPGAALDFGNNIYGDKLNPGKSNIDKFDTDKLNHLGDKVTGKPNHDENWGDKNDIARHKKEAAVKEELMGIKKKHFEDGDKGNDKAPVGKGKDGLEGVNRGLEPLKGKEIKDGGDKPADRLAYPGKTQSQENTSKPSMQFFPDKAGQKGEMPSIKNPTKPNLQADSDEYLL